MRATLSAAEPIVEGSRFRFWTGAAIMVWAAATLAGLLQHLAGAAVAGAGAVAALVVAARRGYLSDPDGHWRDPAPWGIVMMAVSPLVPARLGPSLAGLSLDDLPLVIGTALAAWAVVRQEGWSKVVHPLALPLWLFALWNGVTVLLSGSFSVTELTRGLGRWGLFALAFSLLLRLARRPGLAKTMVLALLSVGLLEALFGIWAYIVDWAVLSDVKAHLIGLEMWRRYQPLFGEVPGRVTGTLGVSSNFFGALMLIPTAIVLGMLARSNDRKRWPLFGVIAAACFFGLVLSYTRASLIALMLGLALLLLLAWRWRVALLVTALVAGALLLTPTLSRFTDEGNDRAALTAEAIERVSEHPLTGAGAGNFVDRTDVLIATPHNSFLLAASETGVPGGLLFATSAVLPGLYLGWSLIRRRNRDPVLVGIAVGLLAFGVQSFSNSLFHIPTVAVGYWMAAAAGVGIVDLRRRGVEPAE